MLRITLLASLVLTLAACEDPTLNIGASIGSDGVRVTPSVTGRSGNVAVSVSP